MLHFGRNPLTSNGKREQETLTHRVGGFGRHFRSSAFLVAQTKNPLQCRRLEFDSWVGKIPLEEEMATHFDILTWRIPQTEEPGRLYSIWGQKSMTE